VIELTCFVAHMDKKGFFEPLGIGVTRENAKDIEREIARTVGLEGRKCPEIWKETKLWLADPKKRATLERNLKRRFAHVR
jgi:hypothetical protein